MDGALLPRDFFDRPVDEVAPSLLGHVITHRTPEGEVASAWTGLNGTMMNCSGGQMPWGAWITCEETVNGPDVAPTSPARRTSR